MLRGWKRLAKNRNFLFCIIAYPVAYCLFLYFTVYLQKHPFAKETVRGYSGISFLVFAFITGFTIYEVIEKRLFHKVQGARLKIKEHQKDWRK